MSARQSYVRVRKGAPVSTDLERLSADFAAFAADILCTGDDQLTRERIAARVLMASERLRQLGGMAEAVEGLASAKTGAL